MSENYDMIGKPKLFVMAFIIGIDRFPEWLSAPVTAATTKQSLTYSQARIS
jgi:hypothetical protein